VADGLKRMVVRPNVRLLRLLIATSAVLAIVAPAARAQAPTAADLDGVQYRHTAGVVYNDTSTFACDQSWFQWVSTDDHVVPFAASADGWTTGNDDVPGSLYGYAPSMLFLFTGGPPVLEGLETTVAVRDPTGGVHGIRVTAPGPGGLCVNPEGLAIGATYRAAATWAPEDGTRFPAAAGPASVAIRRTGDATYTETVGIGSAAAPDPDATPPAPVFTQIPDDTVRPSADPGDQGFQVTASSPRRSPITLTWTPDRVEAPARVTCAPDQPTAPAQTAIVFCHVADAGTAITATAPMTFTATDAEGLSTTRTVTIGPGATGPGPIFDQVPSGEVIGTTAPYGVAFTVSATDPGGGLVHLTWTPDTIWDDWPIRVSCQPAQPTAPAARAKVTCTARNVANDLHLTGVWAPRTTMTFVATNAEGTATSHVVDIGEGDALNAPQGPPQGPSTPVTGSPPPHDLSGPYVSAGSTSESTHWVLTTDGYWEREEAYWADLANGAEGCAQSSGLLPVMETCELVSDVATVGEAAITAGRLLGGLLHGARALPRARTAATAGAPSYASVAQPKDPKLPTLPHTGGRTGRAHKAMLRMARGLARAKGLSSALMTSLSRVHAATAAGDHAAERRQSAAAHRYAAQLATVKTGQHRAGVAVVKALKAMGVRSIPIRSRWAAFQREVQKHGLPRRIAKHLTAEQRRRARRRILATPASDVVVDFYAALNGSAFAKRTDASVAALKAYAASPVS
jgi:hypothetical protein